MLLSTCQEKKKKPKPLLSKQDANMRYKHFNTAEICDILILIGVSGYSWICLCPLTICQYVLY